MEFQEITLQCVDCRQDFVFTVGEQQFYDRKGFRERPKRCKSCRETRKSRRDGADAGQGGRGREVSDGDGNSATPPGGRAQRAMFEATCAACGALARVPFQPAEERPVYCRDCFANRSTGSNY